MILNRGLSSHFWKERYERVPGISMTLFRMVCFVEDQQIDVLKPDERVHEALIKHFCSTDNDHILAQMFLPYFCSPEISIHSTTGPLNLVIKIALKDRGLLED